METRRIQYLFVRLRWNLDQIIGFTGCIAILANLISYSKTYLILLCPLRLLNYREVACGPQLTKENVDLEAIKP